jgi:hypothetical protein
MSHFTAAIVFAIATASFLLGRVSVRVARDRHLEAKRGELMAIKAGLEEVADGLTRREEALRSKWQAMVVNASEISALVNGGEGTWTPEDDRFLDSWSSAESVTRVEE